MVARQVFIGFTTEGTTDERFLETIIERTFVDVAFECHGDVEPVVKFLKVDKTGLGFSEYVYKASQQGVDEIGMMVLCVHADADGKTIDNVMTNKFDPAQKQLGLENDDLTCKIIVPVIPIQMMESWMLADKQLFKMEIGTMLTDNELGINKDPESFSDPKSVIEEAIRISRLRLTKRRRKDLTISDIYMSIGQKVTIDKLKSIPSYCHFQEQVRMAYRKLHLME